MIRISISPDRVRHSARWPTRRNSASGGERRIWLDPTVVNRLRALRGPGESYSDVIIRLAAAAGGKIEWVTP